MNNNQPPSPYGRSLKLVDGDLCFEGGDLALVSGKPNLLQGIQVMIETPFASDIFNVNYGFDALNIITKPESVRVIKELIRLNIVKTVEYDNRVRNVTELVFNDDPRYFELQGERNAEQLAADAGRRSRRERLWNVLVILQTIENEDISFTVEGAGL